MEIYYVYFRRTDEYLCNIYIYIYINIFINFIITQSSLLNSKITQLNTNNIQHLLYKFIKKIKRFVRLITHIPISKYTLDLFFKRSFM